MITPEQEADLLARASVPEHIVSLMTLISKGEPFLLDEYLGLVKDNWLIFIGYPLGGAFDRAKCAGLVQHAVATFKPEYLWFIGPEIPSALLKDATERQTDRYYLFDIAGGKPKPSLLRLADRAAREVTVERGRTISREHEELIAELLKREQPAARVRALYRSLPDYLGHSPSAWTLDARDRRGRLCAFTVVDLAAVRFSAYILGGHSKKRYVPHASDLLFREMISLARDTGKESINLGLGVNEGIRRFKEKWGGIPFLPYEFCECRYKTARRVSLLDALLGRQQLD
ncbi:MAG: hypothetical protein ACYC7J_09480 [Syntrophales bacterium]